MLETIRDSSKSNQDKLRLFIIYYLAHDEISKDDMNEFEKVLAETNIDSSSLNYIKQ